ncbi:MerR family transcriptional regulator [Paenibacillus luteus]|uniref:MerR family transcriptional regulator n=1 Tax=Paenibacillus luteus TaxID=2545753 RepID=UPI001144D04D|nr:MerR family transcriptional regulator [Paenibacillus luteus]
MEKDALYAIGAFAKLTSLTERTLRYYDRKGLLTPSKRNEHGHRFYTERDLVRLQKIVTLKYLDFSLEDIVSYLQRPDEDFQQSLAVQFELLQQKQRHLEKVLDTIGRMQKIVERAGRVDSDLMLVFIHNIQHEENQKQWLSQQMPSSFVGALFMDDMNLDERLAKESTITAMVMELKEHYKQGKEPLDEEVLGSGRRLVAFLDELLGPVLESMNEEELSNIGFLTDREAPIDPILFPNAFTEQEEAYLKIVFDHLEAFNILREELVNGEKS